MFGSSIKREELTPDKLDDEAAAAAAPKGAWDGVPLVRIPAHVRRGHRLAWVCCARLVCFRSPVHWRGDGRERGEGGGGCCRALARAEASSAWYCVPMPQPLIIRRAVAVAITVSSCHQASVVRKLHTTLEDSGDEGSVATSSYSESYPNSTYALVTLPNDGYSHSELMDNKTPKKMIRKRSKKRVKTKTWVKPPSPARNVRTEVL